MLLAGGCGYTNGKPMMDKTEYMSAAYWLENEIYENRHFSRKVKREQVCSFAGWLVKKIIRHFEKKYLTKQAYCDIILYVKLETAY